MSDTERLVLRCFVCAKTMTPVREGDAQPYGGLIFSAGGNYGSRIFDPIATLEKLRALICDECVTERADRLIAVRVQRTKDVLTFRPVVSMNDFKEKVWVDD